MRKSDFWENRWRLTEETGMVLLEIRRRGAFRRGAYLTIIRGELDADLLAFVYYLVYRRWEEQQAAAS